ncbi:AAA family ATPase [Mycetocola saprophilus]|uniref:AAA family ATPase n=1 Tax=Mycetocola saprophilus TaxID=76636 RepID=UPI003BF008EE
MTPGATGITAPNPGAPGVAPGGVFDPAGPAAPGVSVPGERPQSSPGADAAVQYGDELVMRYVVTDRGITADALNRDKLRDWVDGLDPDTGIQRGMHLPSPDADLVLDATINAPKTFSLAALIDPDIAIEFTALQDRLRDRVITTWHRELNARRGKGGRIRQDLARIEVVELRHERSRSLDPHQHRHLWLNMKVQGTDGRWSNLDSRVALKFHTVINAEGDLAARTDPEWIAALAAKGYTVNEAGEIDQLAHLVTPLSRRATQIEANRTLKLTQWRIDNPGEEPTPAILATIDRWAWSYQRPQKPVDLNEDDWKHTVEEELLALDPALLGWRESLPALEGRPAKLNAKRIAIQAVHEADKRARSSFGRFSRIDVRAGVIRAVAKAGPVLPREELDRFIQDTTEAAITSLTHNLIDEDANTPAHIKNLMATDTVGLKHSLAEGLERLATGEPGTLDPELIPADVPEATSSVTLTLDQRRAAAALAGTGRVVTVTGPAGAGKTTLLRAAKVSLALRGRRLIVVAPTKKAATVAGTEVGVRAASLHALLREYGWYAETDDAGHETWTHHRSRMRPPEQRRFPLADGDRVVVDEAGMVDLAAADALMQVLHDTGASVGLIGDEYQAAPIGHSGAMAMAVNRADDHAELIDVHRFRTGPHGNEVDEDYAALSLRVRRAHTPEEAAEVAAELNERGLIVRAESEDALTQHLVEAYFTGTASGSRTALVTASNEHAQQVNERIQAERLLRGTLDNTVHVLGREGQLLYGGDLVQTRRNNSEFDVENRGLWRIAHTDPSGDVVLENATTPGDYRRVDSDYARDHIHLAYASTSHGVQGETTDRSVVAGDVTAAGLYVGLTRGRQRNEVVVSAPTEDAAVTQVADALLRQQSEPELRDSTEAALQEVRRAAIQPPARETHIPSWDDPRRAYGRLSDPAQQIAEVAGPLQELRAELISLTETSQRDELALAELDTTLAREGELSSVSIEADEAKADLTEKQYTTYMRIEELWPEFETRMRTVEALQTEMLIREQLPAAVRVLENTARLANLSNTSFPERFDIVPAPSPADTGPDPDR